MVQKTNRHWRVDGWRDVATMQLAGVEIVPVDDIASHAGSENCACIPVLRHEQGCVPVLIHSAFDGRELDEPNRKERGC